MDFDWLNYLEEFEGVDVSPIRNIIETEEKLIQTVIKEAFSAHPFVSKAEAKMNIDDFAEKSPKGIPEGFVSEYKSKIVSAIDSLTEGEIKIIINNDVNKGSNRTVDVVSDMDEGKKPAGKRGRPKKMIEAAPIEENADEILQGTFVKITGKWYVVDSVNGDTLFVTDANPSDDEHGPVYHKFGTEQVEEVSSEVPAAEPVMQPLTLPMADIGAIGGDDEDEDGTTTISIITPDDFDNDDEVGGEESAEDDGSIEDVGFDLDWSDVEDAYADDIEKTDSEEEAAEDDEPGEEIDGIEIVDEPDDEESDDEEEEEEEEVEEAVDVDGVEDYEAPFEPQDDTSDANGKSNLFNKNNEQSVASEKVGRKFVGRKNTAGITHPGEIEEDLDPETKEALKGISASDPRAKEFFDKMNNRTRAGRKSTKADISDELAQATH